MQRVIFPSGYEVTTDDLSFLQQCLADYIKQRSSEEVFNPGITGTYKAYVASGSTANTIKVVSFNACNSEGERITLPADVDNLAPDATDKTSLVVGGTWTSSIRYVIVARYVESEDTPVVHPITAISANSRVSDSYTLHALRRSGATIDSFLDGDIKLGRVEINGSGLISAIKVNQLDEDEDFELTQYYRLEAAKINTQIGATNPTAYEEGMQLTLQDHINCRGNGTISRTNPHGLNYDISLIPDNSLPAAKLIDLSLTAAQIAAGTITNAKMASNSVDTPQLVNGCVTQAKLSPDLVVSSSYSFTVPGTLAVANKIIQRLVERNITITEILLYADTAPDGADLVVDINRNGTTIFPTSPKPRVTDGSNSGSTSTIDLPDLLKGDRLSLDIDQIGSSTGGGEDLMVTIVYQ